MLCSLREHPGHLRCPGVDDFPWRKTSPSRGPRPAVYPHELVMGLRFAVTVVRNADSQQGRPQQDRERGEDASGHATTGGAGGHEFQGRLIDMNRKGALWGA